MSATAIKSVDSKPPTLRAALMHARAEFDPVLKTKANTFHKSQYADLATVLEAVTPHLCKHSLLLSQMTRTDANGAVILVTELCHVETGEVMTSEWPLVPSKDRDPQALGAAMTYGRRYQALAILGIAPEDDDGNEASGRGGQPQQRKTEPTKAPVNDAPKGPQMTMAQNAKLNEAIRKAGNTSDEARHLYCDGVLKREPGTTKSTLDLTEEEGQRVYLAALEVVNGKKAEVRK